MTQKPTGRPRGTPLERARRYSLRAKRHLERVQREFDERLLIDPRATPEEVQGMMDVKGARMRAAFEIVRRRRALNDARRALREADAGDTAELRRQVTEARSEEKQAWDAYRALPDLGFSYDSWDALPAQARQRPPGKPADDVDVRLARAHEDLERMIEKQKTIEQEEGVPHVRVDQMRDPVKELPAPIGRPPRDRLGILDRRLQLTLRRIEELRSMPPMKPKRLGRRPKPREQKLAEAKAKAEQIRSAIEALESELDAEGRLQRSLKRLRDERRHLKKLEKGGAPASKSRCRRLGYLEKEIRALERLRRRQPARAFARV